MWRGISLASDKLAKGVRRKIYNGADTLFWKDIWLGNEPLQQKALVDFSLVESY